MQINTYWYLFIIKLIYKLLKWAKCGAHLVVPHGGPRGVAGIDERHVELREVRRHHRVPEPLGVVPVHARRLHLRHHHGEPRPPVRSKENVDGGDAARVGAPRPIVARHLETGARRQVHPAAARLAVEAAVPDLDGAHLEAGAIPAHRGAPGRNPGICLSSAIRVETVGFPSFLGTIQRRGGDDVTYAAANTCALTGGPSAPVKRGREYLIELWGWYNRPFTPFYPVKRIKTIARGSRFAHLVALTVPPVVHHQAERVLAAVHAAPVRGAVQEGAGVVRVDLVEVRLVRLQRVGRPLTVHHLKHVPSTRRCQHSRSSTGASVGAVMQRSHQGSTTRGSLGLVRSGLGLVRSVFGFGSFWLGFGSLWIGFGSLCLWVWSALAWVWFALAWVWFALAW
eukprot:1192993-Prorocentrum_minimum.AAC.1